MCDVRVIRMQTKMAHRHHPTRNRRRNEEKQLSNKSSDVKFEACSTECTNVINSKLCAGGEYECRYDTTVSQSTAHFKNYDTSKTLEQLVQSFPIERQKNEWSFRRFFRILIAVVVGGGDGAVVDPSIFAC